ncbi:MAG: SDR family NAD(P)-dependent oxidoreductase [Solirubrobacterales bacterium]|nr:SDR family NAD(P)-dependent oxidoreductase [Solirubrobacterales bacterium]
MADRLEGAAVLVTGASSGIGEATARALAARGAKVALVARRTDRIEKLAKEIAAGGHVALAIEADVTDQEQAIAAVERTAGDFGRLDIVVNNAGVMLLGPIHGAPTEEWDRMIDVNLKGLLYTTHAALPHLFAATQDSPRKVADVVNISSVAGRVASAGAGVYNLTKHGVGAVSEALRQEASRHGVRVTIIEPGFVETELQSHNRPEVHEKLKERTAKIEPLSAHDIADAIEYAVTRPARVSLNELLIRPTTQP